MTGGSTPNRPLGPGRPSHGVVCALDFPPPLTPWGVKAIADAPNHRILTNLSASGAVAQIPPAEMFSTGYKIHCHRKIVWLARSVLKLLVFR